MKKIGRFSGKARAAALMLALALTASPAAAGSALADTPDTAQQEISAQETAGGSGQESGQTAESGEQAQQQVPETEAAQEETKEPESIQKEQAAKADQTQEAEETQETQTPETGESDEPEQPEKKWISPDPMPENYTGLAQAEGEEGIMHFLQNGAEAEDYTNLYHEVTADTDRWVYVENGIVDWNHTLLAQVNGHGTWYYITDSVLDRSVTDLVKVDGVWYNIQNGKWNQTYSGLVPKRSGGWYYVTKGKIDWNYTNLVQYNGGWYYIKNGRLDSGKSTLAQVNGHGAWYYVEKGRVNRSYTGLTQFGGIWYYVEKGKVDWTHTGLVSHNGGWFYVKKGKIDWNYTGLAQVTSGDRVWYYVKKGRIDRSFTGKAQVNGTGKWYPVEKGRYVKPIISNYADSKAQAYSSPTENLILVDRYSHMVYVYKGAQYGWNRIRSFPCTNGKLSTPTISGVFHVGMKDRYFDTGAYGRCWYYTQIYGDYLFHSVIYDRSSSPVHVIDGTMGAAASHGCVRLWLGNAKWIYDNIGYGTTVVIY